MSDCTTPVRILDGHDEPLLTEYAWYCNNASEPQEVAQKLPNGNGLFDMHGNVYEWTGDFDSSALSASVDPWYSGNTYSTVKLIARGGSYSNNPSQITNYFRERSAPETAGGSGFQNIGFRVVRIP